MTMLVPAEAGAVRSALLSLSGGVLLHHLPEEARGMAEVVLAEALNNIVEHAYGSGGGQIEITVKPDAGGLSCLIVDEGKPMPDGALPRGALPPADPADPPEGGFGWYLIRTLSRDLRYVRRDGRNHLSFRLTPDC